MKNYLVKLKYKSQQDPDEQSVSSYGRISLSRKSIACHDFALSDKHSTTKLTLEPRIIEGVTPTTPMSDVVVSPSGGLSGSPALGVVVLGPQTSTVSAATSLGEYTMPERNYWQGKVEFCFPMFHYLHTLHKIKRMHSRCVNMSLYFFTEKMFFFYFF